MKMVVDKFGNRHNLFALPMGTEFGTLDLSGINLFGLKFPDEFKCEKLIVLNARGFAGKLDLTGVKSAYLSKDFLGKIENPNQLCWVGYNMVETFIPIRQTYAKAI